MDRTQLCGSCNVGSIPTERTNCEEIFPLEKALGELSGRNRKPFEPKIDFKKILAKRSTDPVRVESTERARFKNSSLITHHL